MHTFLPHLAVLHTCSQNRDIFGLNFLPLKDVYRTEPDPVTATHWKRYLESRKPPPEVGGIRVYAGMCVLPGHRSISGVAAGMTDSHDVITW
jgi:hypothetical protein